MSDKKPCMREETDTLSEDDERRFKELFNKLDANKDGSIDIKELTSALHGVAIGDAAGRAKVKHKSIIHACRCCEWLDKMFGEREDLYKFMHRILHVI